jgi:putative ABC transport system permease protein
MSAGALQQVSGITAANDIEVKVFDKNIVNATAQALAGVLHAYGITVLNASIIPELNIGPINGLLSIMSVLSIMALILTGFLILNTVSTLVAEQTRIIGMMKAIGGTRRRIIRSYLVSVGMYAVAGTAIGIGLGVLLGYQLAWGIIITSMIVGLAVPFAAAMLPLWTGTRISVRDAMASYGTSSANGGNSKHSLGRRLTWVPQTAWLGLRGVFRKRRRAIMTLLALTLSGTAFLAIQTTTYSFNQLHGQVFNVYNFDAQVTLASPQPYDQVRTRIMTVPNVGRVERTGQQLVKTKWGQVVFWGFEADTQEYHYQLVAGRWFQGDESHALVISDVAAGRTHLKVGDTLTLSSATNTVTWTIIGEIHDLNTASAGFVGVMVTTVNNLNSFNGLPANLAQTLFVQAVDRSPKAIDQLSNRLDETLSQAGLSPGVTTAQQIKNINLSTLQIVYVLLYAVAAIVALVGILGLFNTLTTSVLERRREIGILRSMGATGQRVASVFWLEGVSLGVIAWFVGLLLGIPAAYGFVALISATFVPTPFAFDPRTLGVMLIFILVIATLASFGPVMRAARVRIVDTLRLRVNCKPVCKRHCEEKERRRSCLKPITLILLTAWQPH